MWTCTHTVTERHVCHGGAGAVWLPLGWWEKDTAAVGRSWEEAGLGGWGGGGRRLRSGPRRERGWMGAPSSPLPGLGTRRPQMSALMP